MVRNMKYGLKLRFHTFQVRALTTCHCKSSWGSGTWPCFRGSATGPVTGKHSKSIPEKCKRNGCTNCVKSKHPLHKACSLEGGEYILCLNYKFLHVNRIKEMVVLYPIGCTVKTFRLSQLLGHLDCPNLDYRDVRTVAIRMLGHLEYQILDCTPIRLCTVIQTASDQTINYCATYLGMGMGMGTTVAYGVNAPLESVQWPPPVRFSTNSITNGKVIPLKTPPFDCKYSTGEDHSLSRVQLLLPFVLQELQMLSGHSLIVNHKPSMSISSFTNCQ